MKIKFNFFLKKMSIFWHFLADFQISSKIDFFSKKFVFSSIFIFSPRNEFCFKIYNFFFQRKLTSHTLWFEKPIGKRANILARLKLQIYTCEQKIHFLLSKSKIGAFQLALSRNAISTTESKRTPHFWSRTTLVYIHDSWNKF